MFRTPFATQGTGKSESCGPEPYASLVWSDKGPPSTPTCARFRVSGSKQHNFLALDSFNDAKCTANSLVALGDIHRSDENLSKYLWSLVMFHHFDGLVPSCKTPLTVRYAIAPRAGSQARGAIDFCRPALERICGVIWRRCYKAQGCF